MKKARLFSLIYLVLLTLSVTSCRRSAEDVWDDTRTCGRHMGRGLRSLGGKHGDSRQVYCREDFLHTQNEDYCIEDFQAMDFEPLPDQDYSESIPQATSQRKPVNEPGLSHIPGIESFIDPKTDSSISAIFQNIQFPYNSSLIKGQDNRGVLREIVTYMKQHPKIYLFVEGHCDERGAEAYNLALGTKRSNAVRNLLVKEGVPPENIFTVSYGKERPIDLGHTEEAWAKNRRAEFKIYR